MPTNAMPKNGVSRRATRRAGFTLVEIMIVVLIISTLLNIAAPSMIAARDKGQARSCVKNLNNFLSGKEQYAMDNKIPANSATPITWSNLTPYVRANPGTPATGPVCPTKGDAYNYGTLTVPPTCTYGGPVGSPHTL